MDEVEQLRATVEDLRAQVAAAEERQRALSVENGRMSRELRRARAELDAIKRSRGWRAIKSVRRLRTVLPGARPAVGEPIAPPTPPAADD